MVEEVKRVKLILTGAAKSGRSALFNRYLNDTFDPDGPQTVGAQFGQKTVEHSGTSYRLIVWDNNGHVVDPEFQQSFYLGATAVLITFDITSQESFETLPAWIEEKVSLVGPEVPVIVVGTKADQEDQRRVSTETATEFCGSVKASYIETSAKTGQNISALFELVVDKVKDSV